MAQRLADAHQPVLACGLCLLLAALSAGCGPTPPPLQQAWDLQVDGTFGYISNVVRCGDTLFMADVHNQRIRRYDLANRKFISDISDRVALPIAMAGDCGSHELYVMSPSPLNSRGSPVVQAFEMGSGELRREYDLPRDFLPRPGGRMEGGALLVAGISGRSDYGSLLEGGVDKFYDTEHLGLKLALDSGVTELLLSPYETRCIGAGACIDVRMDSVVGPNGIVRVASLPTSTAIGIYGDSGPPHIVSVKSPRFIRSGETLDVTTPPDARMRWTGRNSIIDSVFAFPDVLAVVHVQRMMGPDWQFGSPTPMAAYMNTYDWDGTTRQQDIRLPGVAAGRDDQAIYVIDYGPEGPREGASKLRVIRVPVS